ncbi:MAG: thioredoxin [Deltaproteobacteria bacterium]|nr:thioredoxin [Deltaproteobacteria bacterium]
MSEVIEVTDATFEQEVLQSDLPVELDFWAPWCGPCMMLGPIYDRLAKEYDNFKFCKINVDQNKEVAMKFGIQSIPMQIFFVDGEAVDHLLGAMPEAQVRAKVDEIIAKYPIDARGRLKSILSKWVEHNQRDTEKLEALEAKAEELAGDPTYKKVLELAGEIKERSASLSRLLEELS